MLVVWMLFLVVGSVAEWVDNQKCPYGHISGGTIFQGDSSYSTVGAARAACQAACDEREDCKFADLYYTSSSATCYLKGANCGDYMSNGHWAYQVYIKAAAEPAVRWDSVGYGGCNGGDWFKIGTARSLDEAKELMLAHPECSKSDSMLFYSDFSYSESWSVRCALSGNHENCTEINGNWKEYILRRGMNSAELGFKVTSGQSYCEVDKNGCVHDGEYHYANHENCEFTFTGDATLYAVEFDIEYNSSCSWDYLEVEGKGKFCGSAFAPIVVSGTTKFTFDTDYSVTRRGFMICVQSWK